MESLCLGVRNRGRTVLIELTTRINRRDVAGVPGIWHPHLTSLLAAETTLYLPSTLQTSDPRALFCDMWRLRKQWTVQEGVPQVGAPWSMHMHNGLLLTFASQVAVKRVTLLLRLRAARVCTYLSAPHSPRHWRVS